MNIAICDDIKEYRLSIECFTNEYMKTHHIDCSIDNFSSGIDLLNSNKKYNIIFLDIELGDSNGIDIAKKLQLKNRNTIILIVTSYHQYLDDAMDINVTRYIDKPVTQNRINSSLDKAISLINENIIIIHTKDNITLKLFQKDIVYVETKLKKVTIYTKNENYIVKETLKQLKDLLNASYFAIPHNSYIVNLNYIKSFKRDEITLIEPFQNENISVAMRKQPEFKRKFLDYIRDGH